MAATGHGGGSDGATGERRRRLLEAADRVVRRDGPGVSMNAIAAEAGVTKPILYRHFGDRDGLFRSLAELHTQDLVSAVRSVLAQPLERRDLVEAALGTYLSAVAARPEAHRYLTGAGGGRSPARAPEPGLRQIAEDIAGAVRARVDLGAETPLLSEVWGRAVAGMLLSAGAWWLKERPCSREQLVRALADLLWGRLAAAGGRPLAGGGCARSGGSRMPRG